MPDNPPCPSCVRPWTGHHGHECYRSAERAGNIRANAMFTCDRCGSDEGVHTDLSCPQCGPLMLCPRCKEANRSATHDGWGEGKTCGHTWGAHGCVRGAGHGGDHYCHCGQQGKVA